MKFFNQKNTCPNMLGFIDVWAKNKWNQVFELEKNFERGAIIWADLGPVRGHEQDGRRPVLVLSISDFEKVSRLVHVVPITTNTKNFPLHLPLDSRTTTRGCVLTEHLLTLDLSKRNPEFIEMCPPDILKKVQTMINETFQQ
ncbi:type II toxin-antitoxin system PemK/MazF family toxin [Lactiplantibacillus plantarum]|uniref:type II toxin-antitoxin system PemK/MazF family toxin n=1 Tax=Lactiplantibacillus plantarum TaxID=1590 RepID=UPI001C9D8F0E|nr:type II toxin-antitoxin system PemK/MazF family toxin [Lactiplantibacillus plantarum]